MIITAGFVKSIDVLMKPQRDKTLNVYVFRLEDILPQIINCDIGKKLYNLLFKHACEMCIEIVTITCLSFK